VSHQHFASGAAREAGLFARYLLDRDPPEELIARYIAASEEVFPQLPTADDAALLAFVGRHPGALPFVDAAAGVLRPGSLLRKKILLMAAILEASVHHAREFLAPPPGRGRTLLALSRYALSSGVKLAIGAVMLATISARRNEGA
jgi:hypothetical protein